MRLLTALAGLVLLSACGGDAAETTAAPDLPRHLQYLDQAIMVYTGTGGWRHEGGIAGGNVALGDLAREAGLGIFTTENPAYFAPEVLDQFEVLVLNNATGVTLDEAQQAALAAWMASGGRLLALHGAGDASHTDWDWYQDTLIGPVFIGHPIDPQFQTATVRPLMADHPLMTGLTGGFAHEEEWYSFDGLPGANFLPVAGVTETEFAPILREGAAASDDPSDHPVLWVACPGAGRSVYSALGHSAASFEAPAHRRLLRNALAWLRADDDYGCPA